MGSSRTSGFEPVGTRTTLPIKGCCEIRMEAALSLAAARCAAAGLFSAMKSRKRLRSWRASSVKTSFTSWRYLLGPRYRARRTLLLPARPHHAPPHRSRLGSHANAGAPDDDD